MLYHVSAVSGISVLKPQVSTHGKAYVYAIRNLTTGLLFGTKHDDFDFMILEEDGRTEVYECYPDAFCTIFRGKRCSIYEIPEDDFVEGVTGWEPELVCGHEVTVEQEMLVEDLYEKLLEEQMAGNLVVHRYEDQMEYKKRISEHIIDRLIRFEVLDREMSDVRFEKYYKNIIEALREIMDGHLL